MLFAIAAAAAARTKTLATSRECTTSSLFARNTEHTPTSLVRCALFVFVYVFV